MPPERNRAVARRLSGSGRAPSIGFLIDGVEDSPYHWQILRGAMHEAYARGAHFVVFVGGALTASDPPTGSNWVYNLARPDNVDALVLSGSLGNAAGSQAVAAFCARCPPMPICSIAVPLPGAASVCLDNAAGMRAVIEHLVRVHGIRQIAFVRGPVASDEAELRLNVYREVLQANAIGYDPQLVVSGDFMPAAGRDAVATLFDGRKLPVAAVGAIAAANDAMATGVIDELCRRGIRVPDVVAVTGFDDIQEARFSNPPLTTVAQRLDDQGRECVRIVMDQLRAGEARAEQVVRSADLVTRRSCGCLSTPSTGEASAAPPSTSLSFDSALIRDRQRILTDMARAARGALGVAGAQWDARLLNAAADQIRGDRPDAFIRVYDEILVRVIDAGGDVSTCNDVLSALRTRLVRCIGDTIQRTKAEDFFHEARVMTTHAVERTYVGRTHRAANAVRAVMQAGASILAARSLDELASVIAEQMPRAGIHRCFIARFSDGVDGGPTAQEVLAVRPQASRANAAGSASLSPTDVLRHALSQTSDVHAFVLFPAAFAGGQKAIVLLELGATEGVEYEVLRKIFTGVLSRLD